MLSSQEKLQYIKTKVVEVCPEVMELSFGCEVIYKTGRNDFDKLFSIEGIILDKHLPKKYKVLRAGKYLEVVSERDIGVILGHAVHLTHILRTLEANRELVKQKISVDSKGYLTLFDMKWEPKEQVEWELAKDLNDQSEDTIDFLYQLIK